MTNARKVSVYLMALFIQSRVVGIGTKRGVGHERGNDDSLHLLPSGTLILLTRNRMVTWNISSTST